MVTAGSPAGVGAELPGGAPAARILLAEDDADLRRMLAYVLRRAGYAVLEAADGPGALALARAARPAVAVLDGRLPGLGGLEVARALAADPDTAGVRVILATGAPPSGDSPAGRGGLAGEAVLPAGAAGPGSAGAPRRWGPPGLRGGRTPRR